MRQFQVGDILSPKDAMILAIQEGHRGAGFVSPNPKVGCVILDASSRLLASGFHRAYGQDHAEIDAFKKIKDTNLLKGAHLYVTLEPCSHQGKTPPCADAMAVWPLASVTYGLQDPNPKVAGRGVEKIRAAGMDIRSWSERVPSEHDVQIHLEELCEEFLYSMRRQESFISLKVATSLDGMMALKSGESQWITNEESRARGHLLRAQHDAVLIGRGTFEADNPSLNVRLPEFAGRITKVIILDSKAAILNGLAKSNVALHRNPSDIYVVVQEETWQKLIRENKTTKADSLVGGFCKSQTPEGFQIVCAPQGLALPKAFYQEGLQSILIEGGRHIYASFLKADWVQRVHLFMNPSLIGGQSGILWSEGLNTKSLSSRLSLKNPRSESLSDDLYLTGTL